MQIISIDRDDFEDAINGNSGNFVADHDFREMAIQHELMIYDRDSQCNLMIRVPEGTNIDETPESITNFYNEVLVSYTGIAKYLNISESDAIIYIHKTQIDPIATLDEMSCDGIYWKSDFDQKMICLAKQIGISAEDAQLRLGITEESFEEIKKYIPCNDGNKFLPPILEGFFRKYLNKKIAYSSITTAVEDFVNNFNANHPDFRIEEQYCEECGDDAFTATDKCCSCGKYLCPKHAHWDTSANTSIALVPPKFCTDCLSKEVQKT